ncbi:MarR family transcriptional regulator [Bdellovibrio sp.]|uniref:MarR family winged helix-turn-helix transcriptional regulator n=1 Tax=Bdellovibrio TaxID=958 RepID=UPI00322163DC
MSKNDSELLGICLADTLVAMKRYLLMSFEKTQAAISFEEWMNLRPLLKQAQTQRDLAYHLGKDKTTVSRLLDEWEKRKLVRRIPHTTDGRTKLIELTPAARRMHQELAALVSEADLKFCSLLSGKDRKLMIIGAEKIRQALHECE